MKGVVLQVGLEEEATAWAVDVIKCAWVSKGARDTDGVALDGGASVEAGSGWVVDSHIDTGDEVGASDLGLERVAVSTYVGLNICYTDLIYQILGRCWC